MRFPVSTIRALVLMSLLLAAAASSSRAAERVPGTQVSLEPPAGFLLSPQFPGFQNAEAAASIMVTELNAPAAQLRAAMTEEGLASRGMTLLATAPHRHEAGEATLLHASQNAGGSPYRKWMLVFGSESRTVMVVGTFPEALAADLSDPIRSAVLSARWDPDRAVGIFDGLTFRIAETPSLKLARRISNTVMLTRDGRAGRVAPQDPLVVVGASLSAVAVENLETFARQRLAQTAEIEGLAGLEGRETSVDGLPAYELTAKARDRQSGLPLKLYQLVALEEGGTYYLVQGLVGEESAAQMVPEFRDLAASLTRVR